MVLQLPVHLSEVNTQIGLIDFRQKTVVMSQNLSQQNPLITQDRRMLVDPISRQHCPLEKCTVYISTGAKKKKLYPFQSMHTMTYMSQNLIWGLVHHAQIHALCAILELTKNTSKKLKKLSKCKGMADSSWLIQTAVLSTWHLIFKKPFLCQSYQLDWHSIFVSCGYITLGFIGLMQVRIEHISISGQRIRLVKAPRKLVAVCLHLSRTLELGVLLHHVNW